LWLAGSDLCGGLFDRGSRLAGSVHLSSLVLILTWVNHLLVFVLRTCSSRSNGFLFQDGCDVPG
jgi:hypothetical protein